MDPQDVTTWPDEFLSAKIYDFETKHWWWGQVVRGEIKPPPFWKDPPDNVIDFYKEHGLKETQERYPNLHISDDNGRIPKIRLWGTEEITQADVDRCVSEIARLKAEQARRANP